MGKKEWSGVVKSDRRVSVSVSLGMDGAGQRAGQVLTFATSGWV